MSGGLFIGLGEIVGEWIDDELKCINARYSRLSLIRSPDPL